MNIHDILKDYKDLSSGVFSDSSCLSLFKTEYSQEKLKYDVKKILYSCGLNENVLIRDLPKKVVITTVNLDDKAVNRWRMDFIENLTPAGGNIKVIDAILEATAAPTYFPSVHGHVDGGVAMNDPSLAGLMFAYKPTDDLRDFRLLSIGTGYDPHFIKGDEKWGKFQWLLNGASQSGHVPLLNLLMDVEGEVPEQVMAKLLGERYMRIDFPLPEVISLDDYKKIKELIKYTQHFTESNFLRWRKAITWAKHYLGLLQIREKIPYKTEKSASQKK